MNVRSDIYTFNPQSSSFSDTSRVSNTSDPVVPLYQPTDLGYEAEIKKRLDQWRSLQKKKSGKNS